MKVFYLDNLTNISAADLREYMKIPFPTAFIWCLNVAFGISTTFGVLGNIVVVAVILATPALRNLPNFLVCNMAVADLLVAVTVIPFMYLPSLNTHWPYSDFLCKFMNGFPGLTIFSSSITIILISVERLHSVKRGIRSARPCTAACLILFSWGSSFFLAFPSFLYQHKVHYKIRGDNETVIESCQLIMPGPHQGEAAMWIFNVTLLMFIYVFPLLVIVITNTRIQKFVVDTARTRKSLIGHRSGTLDRKNERIFELLLAMSICYGLLRLPWSIWYVVQELQAPDIDGQIIRYVDLCANCLASFHVCVNPILFGYMNTNFQRAIFGKLGALRERAELSMGRSGVLSLALHSTRAQTHVLHPVAAEDVVEEDGETVYL